MTTRKFIISSSLAAALLVPLAVGATPTARGVEGCALAGYTVTKVVPYRIQERTGRGTVQKLVGAKLFVAAQPGLSAEWIGATVKRHLRQMQTRSMPGCPLDVNSVKVSVASAGTGYWVQIAGKDSTAAKEILARAQHFVH